LFHAKYPEHKGFFRLKPFKEEKEIERLEELGYNEDTRLFG
jgi:hypothetical protein